MIDIQRTKEDNSMPLKRTNLALTTTIGSHRIARLPGVKEAEFIGTLTNEVLAKAPLPDLDRVTNVVAQELLKDDSELDVKTCIWAIHFNGLHRPDDVRDKCEAMNETVREKLESVGERKSLTLATLEAEWKVEP